MRPGVRFALGCCLGWALALGFLTGLEPGPHFWWQLADGHRVLDGTGLPVRDFTTGTAGIDHELGPHRFLSSAAWAIATRRLGMAGALALGSTLAAFALVVIWSALVGRQVMAPFQATTCALAAGWALVPALGLDDRTMSLVPLAALTALALGRGEDPDNLYWLLVVIPVWSTLSPTWVLALPILALWIAGDLLDRVGGDAASPPLASAGDRNEDRAPGGPSCSPWKILALAGGALLVVLSMPIPAGDPLASARALARSAAVSDLWRPGGWPLGAELLGLAWITSLPSSRGLPLGLILQTAALGLLALLDPDMVPFFVLSTIPGLHQASGAAAGALPLPQVGARAGRMGTGLVLLALAASLRPARAPRMREEDLLPALDAVVREAPAGNLLHDIADGGFLALALGSRRAPLVTTRLEPHPESVLEDYRDMLAGRRTILLDMYGIDTVLLAPSVPLSTLLAHDPGWTTVPETGAFRVHRRWQWYRGGKPPHIYIPQRDR